MSQMFKALGDENRIQIIEMLQKGELCAASILEELNITQPTLSHHMKILCDTGIVECRKSGKWTYYRISGTGCGLIAKWLEKVIRGGASASKGTPRKSNPKKAKNTIIPRTAPEIVSRYTERAEQEEREQRRLRDIDIVIL